VTDRPLRALANAVHTTVPTPVVEFRVLHRCHPPVPCTSPDDSEITGPAVRYRLVFAEDAIVGQPHPWACTLCRTSGVR
jgi:hypothetical protein